jgi:hypothetical protein
MRNVLVNSGGASAWTSLRSATEVFSVETLENKKTVPSGVDTQTSAPRIIRLLDDWSAEKALYRRRTQGETSAPVDHNGESTFTVKQNGRSVDLPEFDQARLLVDRLPAAAAEITLRRPEYILKLSKLQACEIGIICIDVFRTTNSTVPLAPEQQWKISAATGLPVSIRYQVTSVGSQAKIWQEVYFLKYGAQQQLIIPVSIGFNFRGQRQVWTFVSLAANPSFDTSRFDEEAAQ